MTGRRAPSVSTPAQTAIGQTVAQVGPSCTECPPSRGLGEVPDEDTRPEAVVERHEPSCLGVGGAACGELAVLW